MSQHLLSGQYLAHTSQSGLCVSVVLADGACFSALRTDTFNFLPTFLFAGALVSIYKQRSPVLQQCWRHAFGCAPPDVHIRWKSVFPNLTSIMRSHETISSVGTLGTNLGSTDMCVCFASLGST